MGDLDSKLYTDKSIESLSPLEFTRLRPGVYAGDTTYSTQLLVEIVSNAVDEFRLGHGNLIEVVLSGNKISIRHRDGSSSWYLHLHTRAVAKGAHVNTRQVIGRVGNTGRSTGPHLHFGFKDEKGRWMNPSKKTMIATPKLEGERLSRLKSQAKAIRESLTTTAAVTPQKVGDSEILVRSRTIQ
jgi:murein DD-endopeptidase MepM/ murein hydrolase activator NlpD